MATKKTKAKAAKSQVALIVQLLKRRMEPAKVSDRVNAELKGRCTPGYVRWVGRKNNLLAVAS